MLTQSHRRERTSSHPSRNSSTNGRVTRTAPRTARPPRTSALIPKLSASTPIAHPVPTVATSVPPRIGPAMFAVLTEKKSSAFASCSRSGDTVCGVSPLAAGW